MRIETKVYKKTKDYERDLGRRLSGGWREKSVSTARVKPKNFFGGPQLFSPAHTEITVVYERD